MPISPPETVAIPTFGEPAEKAAQPAEQDGGFEQVVEGVDPNDVGTAEKGVEYPVASRDGPGMGGRHAAGEFRAPDLERDDGLALFRGAGARGGEGFRVADGFDEEGDHMRGVVVDQIVHVVGEPEGRFVAGGNEAGEPGHAVGVAERQQHRAALGDDADVAGAERLRERGAVHAGLVGDVGIAHAVGAAEQQAGLMAEIVDAPLHGPAFPARFGKSAGKTPDPLDACGVRLLKHGQQRTAAQQHGGAVRRGGEIAQGRVAGVPKDFLILWVDGIHRTRIAEALHVPEDDGTRPPLGMRRSPAMERGVNKDPVSKIFSRRLLCPAVRGVPCGVLVWDTGCFFVVHYMNLNP